MIQAVGVPIRPVSCKTSAIMEKVVLLESEMLTSYRRDQIVAVIRSYSFVTNVKRIFQVLCKLIFSLVFRSILHYLTIKL